MEDIDSERKKSNDSTKSDFNKDKDLDYLNTNSISSYKQLEGKADNTSDNFENICKNYG